MRACIKLFDDIVRKPGQLDRADRSMATWELLNYSSRPNVAVAREELERWLSRYPAEHRAELVRRFRTDSQGDSLAPFLELFLHEMLLRFECRIEVHPATLSGKRPDFRVTGPTGKRFLVEAAVAYEESASDRGAAHRRDDFVEALNRMKDRRFSLSVWVEGDSRRPIPGAKFRRQIEHSLARVDPEKIDAEGLRWTLESDGVAVEVKAFPRPLDLSDEPSSRPIAVLGNGMREVCTWEAVRDAVSEKATRYGDIDLPYVVAVLAKSRSGLKFSRTEAMQALFGQEAVEYVSCSHGIRGRDIRIPNGVWVGPQGPRNTRLSACLIFDRLRPWSIVEARVCLYHNPWAKERYGSVLCRLPQAVPGTIKMEWVDGVSLADVFELPSSWPD